MPATSLADLDPDEFRRFLDTVSAEEFAKTLEEDEAAESEDEEDDDEDEDEEDDEDETLARRPGLELALRQREQLVDQAVEPGCGERPVVRGRELRPQVALAVRVEAVDAELALEPPELGDEPQPLVHGGDDGAVVLVDRCPQRVEVAAHDPSPPSPRDERHGVEDRVRDHRRVARYRCLQPNDTRGWRPRVRRAPGRPTMSPCQAPADGCDADGRRPPEATSSRAR